MVNVPSETLMHFIVEKIALDFVSYIQLPGINTGIQFEEIFVLLSNCMSQLFKNT